MKDNGHHITYIFREIVIVVIGVLISISIYNYKEKLDNEQYIKKTLLAIENEIKLGQSDVDTVLNRHLALLDYIGNNIDNEEETLYEIIADQGGIQFPDVKNIGLRFFIANKAELVDFDVISMLSEIETNKNMLTSKFDKLLEFSYENMYDNDVETKTKFAVYLSNVVDSEQTLLKLYADYIDKHGEKLKKKEEDR